MSDIVIDVVIEAAGWDALPEAEALVEAGVEAAIAVAKLQLLPGAEISVMLADDARLRELNRIWRAQDKPTNVLSFPAVSVAGLAKAPLLGDVVIAFETLAREAQTEGKTQAAHLSHLVVHGVLHLLGHDHVDEAGACVMEDLERTALAQLGYPDPYRGEEGEPALTSMVPQQKDSGHFAA